MIDQTAQRFLADASENFTLHGLATPEVEGLVNRVLDDTGRQSKRACPLRARLIVWLVVLMALHRNCSIVNVFGRVIELLKGSHPGLERDTVTPEALYHARRRLGASAMKQIYRETVKLNPVLPTFKGLRLYGIDGSEFTVADTRQNEAVFGRHNSARGTAAYPQLRGMFLVALAFHRITNCCFMPLRSGEAAALPFLIAGLGFGDLLMMDRGLTSFSVINGCKRKGANFLLRFSSTWKPKLEQRLGPGDYLMRFKPCSVARSQLPIEDRKNEYLLRVLEFQVGQGQLVRLVTDLVDPEQYPALELAQLYHLRWECEITYKELKSQLVAVTGSKQQTHFRSKTPIGVLQEAWGMVLAHLLVRDLMVEGAAATAEVLPLELSMTDSLEVITASLTRFQAAADAESRQKVRTDLTRQLGKCRIDRPRKKQQYPRVVKRKMSNFPVKRPTDRSSPLNLTVDFVDRWAS